MKAATFFIAHAVDIINISIHAAREGGDGFGNFLLCHAFEISIHAAREGGDAQKNPRLPMFTISIHAAREGGDICAQSV